MAGRRPKPEVLKQLAGNPGHRKARAEIKPVGSASCPAWLDKIGRDEWNRLASHLELLGLLSANDQAPLAAYCNAYSMLVRANRALKKGFTYTHNGLTKKRPEVGIVERAQQEMRKFAQEFGMTPSSRSKVSPNQLPLPGVPDKPSMPALPGAPADPHSRFFDAPPGASVQ